MKIDEEIFASWSELALQDLLMDAAAVVDATDRTSNATSSMDLSNLRPSARRVQRRE